MLAEELKNMNYRGDSIPQLQQEVRELEQLIGDLRA